MPGYHVSTHGDNPTRTIIMQLYTVVQRSRVHDEQLTKLLTVGTPTHVQITGMNEASNHKHKHTIRVSRRVVLSAIRVLMSKRVKNIAYRHQIGEKDGEKKDAHGGTSGMVIPTGGHVHDNRANRKSAWKAVQQIGCTKGLVQFKARCHVATWFGNAATLQKGQIGQHPHLCLNLALHIRHLQQQKGNRGGKQKRGKKHQ